MVSYKTDYGTTTFVYTLNNYNDTDYTFDGIRNAYYDDGSNQTLYFTGYLNSDDLTTGAFVFGPNSVWDISFSTGQLFVFNLYHELYNYPSTTTTTTTTTTTSTTSTTTTTTTSTTTTTTTSTTTTTTTTTTSMSITKLTLSTTTKLSTTSMLSTTTTTTTILETTKNNMNNINDYEETTLIPYSTTENVINTSAKFMEITTTKPEVSSSVIHYIIISIFIILV